MHSRALVLPAALAWPLLAALGQEPSPEPRGRQLLGAQVTVIGQRLFPFPAPYDGPRSLDPAGDGKATHTYGVYFGARLPAHFQAYLDIEMARGAGVSNANGLAGVTNGDVIRQGTANLSSGPYVARALLRYSVGFGRGRGRGRGRDTLARGIDQLPGGEPSARLDVKAGKLAVSDDFDQNRYANSARTQFMNWALFNNTAWDFAGDTRAYTWGAVVAWVEPRWVLRVGTFAMPTMANGNQFDGFPRARGDNIELTIRPGSHGTVVRALLYENHARMGSYAEALARAAATNTTPDIVAADRPGRTKQGAGLNVEQRLADGGETGLFARAGWNDGRNEDFVFTEVDRHLSGGLQLAGAHWKRGADRLGIAYVLHGLSSDHRAYLAAGGQGFLLGDGRLRYGPEGIFETYYRAQFGPYVEVGPDVQWIHNPGYNRDRGPAAVASLRLNVRY
ncbi:MAG TPA: carbohydrate porin [Gemmatimonadales bacterium]|nr:carbohydrate porin [Gemmatimonadales bacterium]